MMTLPSYAVNVAPGAAPDILAEAHKARVFNAERCEG